MTTEPPAQLDKTKAPTARTSLCRSCRRWLVHLDPTTPLNGHSSAVTDARRFAVLIALIFFVSAYAVVEESSRRALLPTVLFLDYVLHAMDYADANPLTLAASSSNSLSPGGSSYQGFKGKVVIDRSQIIEDQIPTVSMAGLFCANVYKVAPNEVELQVEDSYSKPLLGPEEKVTPLGVHILIEFNSLCAGQKPVWCRWRLCDGW